MSSQQKLLVDLINLVAPFVNQNEHHCFRVVQQTHEQSARSIAFLCQEGNYFGGSCGCTDTTSHQTVLRQAGYYRAIIRHKYLSITYRQIIQQLFITFTLASRNYLDSKHKSAACTPPAPPQLFLGAKQGYKKINGKMI
jgi:hypothetical protein